jgi:phenylacetate-CoA ligase
MPVTAPRRLRRQLARLVPAATGSRGADESLAESQWLPAAELAVLQAGLLERLDRPGRGPRRIVGRTVASSGTGGVPKHARWSVEAMRWQDAAEARSRHWAGLDPGASRIWVCCTPPDPLRRVGALLRNTRIVAAGEVAGDEIQLAALADDLVRRPPDALQGVSNVLAALARELDRRSVALPGTVCLSAGNHLTPWYRRQLEAVFARPVRERYAVSEVGLIAASCELGNLHVTVENLLVEVADVRGDPVAPGDAGEITVTMLRNGASARRPVGDVGRLRGEPCGCGRGLPTIELLGRASEQVRLSDGRMVAPSELFAAIDDPSIADARFRHLTEQEVLEVEIQRARGRGLEGAGDRLAALVGPQTRVLVSDVARLEPGASGKLPLVASV